MPILPITLNDGFSPLVQAQDTVHIGQIIATRLKATEVSVSLADELGLPPKKLVKYIQKNPGDSVQPGDEIASKKNFWGKTEAAVISSIAGIVTRYDREKGIIFIKPSGQSDDEEALVSPIEGIISLCNNEKILIETDKHFVVGSRGSGGQNSEVLVFIHENNSDTVQTHELTVATIGKIVLGKYFPRELLIKSVSIGVAGIIGTKFLDEDMVYLQSRKITTPVIEVGEDDLPKLKHWHNKRAFMHGEGKTIILLHE